jgi:hypothetical protein
MKKQKKEEEEEEEKRVYRGGPSSSLNASEDLIEVLEPMKTIGEMEKENYEKHRITARGGFMGVFAWLLIILLPLGFWLLLTLIL